MLVTAHAAEQPDGNCCSSFNKVHETACRVRISEERENGRKRYFSGPVRSQPTDLRLVNPDQLITTQLSFPIYARA
jgi:hypothetical protein